MDMTHIPMPVALTHIREAREAMLADPHHDLGLSWRQRLWHDLDTQPDIPEQGRLRCACLAYLTGVYALPVWLHSFAADQRPRALLQLAEQVATDITQCDVALTRAQTEWHALMNTMPTLTPPIAALAAAIKVLYAVAVGEPLHVPSQTLTHQADITSTPDAAWYTAFAISGGLPDDAKSDDQRRQDFWEWWLLQAFPTAYTRFPSPPPTPITFREARDIALEYLALQGDFSAAGNLASDLAEMVTKPYGWVFFYNTRAYLKNGNSLDALMGNAPFLVERQGGNIVVFGTEHPIATYLAEYEQIYEAQRGQAEAPAPSIS